ncbi:response regulator [Flavobacterium sp.]|jgi:YesN/AraC family two-component response regulator|uniref:response regulator n=1 Tax=Flavobacterium sp. TaxID=239 RepID=UPI002A800B3E|nr:response regulator [Flavobacterium sp.]
MSKYKILIVEDELLIAHHIKQIIEKENFECVGIAIGYNEAFKIIKEKEIDLILLDVNLFGNETGIDIAKELNKSYKIPFVYLTSYSDDATLKLLKETLPMAYLSKPINSINLITTIEIVCNNIKFNNKTPFIFILNNKQFNINLSDLKYVKYKNEENVVLVFKNDALLLETSLNNLLTLLPSGSVKKINKNTAVNPMYISEIINDKVHIQDDIFELESNFKNNLH